MFFEGFTLMVNVTMSWSLMPGTTFTSAIRAGVEDRTKSSVFKDAVRVG